MANATPTADLAAIKPIGVPSPAAPNVAPQTYQIPVTQQLPLADGSGNATVVVQVLRVTPAQLAQQITQSQQQITNAQAQIDKLTAQLNAIKSIEAATAVKAVPAAPLNTAVPAVK